MDGGRNTIFGTVLLKGRNGGGFAETFPGSRCESIAWDNDEEWIRAKDRFLFGLGLSI
jgi:hypothetical protein